MVLQGILLCQWQFCLSFCLELPDFIRTRGIRYSKIWCNSLGWIKHVTSQTDLLTVGYTVIGLCPINQEF